VTNLTFSTTLIRKSPTARVCFRPILTNSGIYLLGYLPTHNRIYVADKDLNISSYALSLNVVEYQTAILRGDMEAAEALLPSIPTDQRNRIARFLEAQGEHNHFLLWTS
jgi:hypothetical protein